MKYLKAFGFVIMCFVAIKIGDVIGELVIKNFPYWLILLILISVLTLFTVAASDLFKK